MRRLIVNADDLGADEARNAGIIAAIKCGTITSISILTNGPAFEDALDGIKSSRLHPISIGLHLNLSEGRPLTPGLKHLTGPDGCFLGKKGAQQVLQNTGSAEVGVEIRTELRAQIARLRDHGIRADHLDGHQHLHFFPAALEIVLVEAKAHGIAWLRIADEEPTPSKIRDLSPLELDEALMFSRHAKAARHRIRESGLWAPDHFCGLFFKGRLPGESWSEFLRDLSPGLTEMMVHPGHAENSTRGPFSTFSTFDRERELKALSDGSFLRAIIETGVELTPFPEAPISR